MKKTITVTTDLLETHLNLEITEKVIYIERDAMTSMERARWQRLIIHFFFFVSFLLQAGAAPAS